MQRTQRIFLFFLLLCALCNLASLRWKLIEVVDLSSYGLIVKLASSPCITCVSSYYFCSELETCGKLMWAPSIHCLRMYLFTARL